MERSEGISDGKESYMADQKDFKMAGPISWMVDQMFRIEAILNADLI